MHVRTIYILDILMFNTFFKKKKKKRRRRRRKNIKILIQLEKGSKFVILGKINK